MIRWFIISSALLGTLSLLFGLLVYLKNRSSKVNKVWMILNFSASLWAWSLFARELSSDKNTGLFFVRLCYVGAIFIPPLFFHFISAFIKEIRRTPLIGSYIISFVFLLLDFTPLFIADVRPILSFRYYGIPGIAFPFFVFYFILIVGYSHYMVIRHYKFAEGRVKNQIRYLFVATALGFIGGGSTFLPNFNIEVFPFGFYLISTYVAIMSYAIVRHRLLDIQFVLKKGTTYFLLLLLLFVPSFFLILLSQTLFFRRVDSLFSILVFSLLFLVAFLFQKIKPAAERAVEQILFKSRYDYKETLSKFSKALVTILELNPLCSQILENVTEAMGVKKASLFLLNEEKGGYFLVESKNIDFSQPTLPKGDPLSNYLQKIGEIVVREELAKGAHLPELEAVVDRMAFLGAEVSIPLSSKGRLIGMINLSHKFNKDIYSHEDIELLTTLANQAAVAIENARLYEDLKRSKSYIRRADRLASLGTLTAGLAHEIRNPLVAIKTFTQLLPERIDDEEFRNHFLQIASDEVNRISSLINELLEFARPSKPNFEPEDLNAILDGMILLVSTESKKKHIQVVKEYGTDLPQIQIDREQMKQVFLNILLNAIDATPEEGMIIVRTRSFTKPNGERFIQIEFKDNGCGIPKENLEEIFTPFFTTKSKGSGLGLPISNQIVQDHKGYIDVESEPGKGTSFFVNLPLKQDHPMRRATDLEKREDLPGFA